MSESSEKLDVSQFNIDMTDKKITRSTIAIVGLGATGSSFMLLLAHFLKNYNNYDVKLFDYDYIESHNYNVSMYGFASTIGVNLTDGNKANSSRRIVRHLANLRIGSRNRNNNNVLALESKVTMDLLEAEYPRGTNLDYIFIFTDNNESRHEIAKYHQKYPGTIVLDCRVGSYSQFEVYFSNNPTKYMKTIYFDDDKVTPSHIEGNNICLDQRMNFSIAMSSASLLMNLFIKYLKDDMKSDFKHIMIGDDYIGEVTGYE